MRCVMMLAGALVASLAGWSPTAAQETAPPAPADTSLDAASDADTEAPTPPDVAEAAPVLTAEALDDLVAPVALYPDSLLTQVLVASTYPLDLVKADRFLSQNADLSDKDRADATEGEDWDPSVQVLAAGFPTVVQRMAADIDWTEDLGDAMLAQTDDLLDAVQRLRAQAAATGNLTSNEAQTVATEGDDISIAPTDPQVVYVPTYDPVTTYTTPAPVAPVPTATVIEDDGVSVGGVLATGAIAFGTALLVDEIFDDDDDDWDDYWHGPRHIDWDDDRVYPGYGRNVRVDGDVNFNRDIDRERNVNRVVVDADGNRKRIDVDRNDRTRIGNDPRDPGRDGAWKPDEARKQDARDRLADRKPDANGKPPGKGQSKAKARSDKDSGARAKLAEAERRDPARPAGDRPKPTQRPAQEAKTIHKDSAFKPGDSGAQRTKDATIRGATSKKKDASPVAKTNRAPAVSKPKAIAKPAAKPHVTSPPRKAPERATAFKKPSSGGAKAKAASKRGGAVKRRH